MYKVTRSNYLILVVVTCSIRLLPVATETQTIAAPAGTFIGNVENVEIDVDGNLETVKVTSFLGIPYAKPPIGDRRFNKPEPLGPFAADNPFSATQYGDICIQEFIVNPLPTEASSSEDCLFLNIFVKTSTPDNANISTMVFFHGDFGRGDFRTGGSNFFPGDALAAYGNIIVVTFNYRLGYMGFLVNEGTNLEGNYAMWDQHLVLKWVHDNIEAFHGSPDKVTLVGQQSGAVCALYHAMYPGNEGLFQRVIAHSGSPISIAIPETGAFYSKPTKYKVMSNIICPFVDDTKLCMQGQNITKLISMVNTAVGGDALTPIIDGDYIRADPTVMLDVKNTEYKAEQDFFNSLDLLIGYNDLDGLHQTLYRYRYNLDFVSAHKWYMQPEDLAITLEMFEICVNYSLKEDIYGKYNENDKDMEKVRQNLLDRYTDILNPDQHRDLLVKYITDYMFLQPIVNLVNYRRQCIESVSGKSSHGHVGSQNESNPAVGQTFLYKFKAESGLASLAHPRPSWAHGARAGDELPYLFGFSKKMLAAYNNSNYVPTSEQITLSKQMMAKWTHFMETGFEEPSPTILDNTPLPEWMPLFDKPSSEEDQDDDGDFYLPYLELSLNMDLATANKTEFGGFTAPFWENVRTDLRFIFSGKPEVDHHEETGDIFGMDIENTELVVIVLISVCGLLIIMLLATCCLCMRRSYSYDSVNLKMKNVVST